ncbi:hypothetical protein J6590_008041 [Homalodisca vitripennis]|nr:hypothetical protein J6590_008041 [Homalodisca vitripennis]
MKVARESGKVSPYNQVLQDKKTATGLAILFDPGRYYCSARYKDDVTITSGEGEPQFRSNVGSNPPSIITQISRQGNPLKTPDLEVKLQPTAIQSNTCHHKTLQFPRAVMRMSGRYEKAHREEKNESDRSRTAKAFFGFNRRRQLRSGINRSMIESCIHRIRQVLISKRFVSFSSVAVSAFGLISMYVSAHNQNEHILTYRTELFTKSRDLTE